jgi:DNA invertase Pin-like site-specific DNA recombinase
MIGEFDQHNVAIVATSQGIDTNHDSPAGRLQMHVLMAVAQFERTLIVERVRAGQAAARGRGVKFGRPSTLGQHKEMVLELSKSGWACRRIAAQKAIPLGSVFRLSRALRVATSACSIMQIFAIGGDIFPGGTHLGLVFKKGSDIRIRYREA